MLHLVEKTRAGARSDGSLTLTFEQRAKSRLRAVLDDGREVAVVLERGMQLHQGDTLRAKSGELINILAALETLSVIRCDDPHLLARACYHLGNRHIALQITPGELRYQHDHVLDEMIKLLGLEVQVRQARFEPESGAYGGHAHIHNHEH